MKRDVEESRRIAPQAKDLKQWLQSNSGAKEHFKL